MSLQRRIPGWDTLFLFVILVGALALRVLHLAAPSLWHDEAHTWWIARLSPDLFFQALAAIGVHPPLYFLGVKALIPLIGESEAALRALSVLADLAALFIAYHIGWLTAGRSGGVVAAWFWSFHPMAVWFARDARPYALAAVLSAALVAVFLRYRSQPSKSGWWLVSLLVAAGTLTHFYFFLPVGVLILISLLDLPREPAFFRYWTGASILGLAPLALWLAWFFRQPNPSLGIGWIQTPTLIDLPGTLWNMISGYGGVVATASLLFGLAGLVFIVSGLWTSSEARRFLLMGIVLPLLSVWGISYRRPIYLDRYFIVLLPILLIPLSHGAQRFWAWLQDLRAEILAVPVGLIMGVFAMGIGILAAVQVHFAPHYAREDWRGLAQVFLSRVDPEQSVWLADPEAVVPLSYYLPGEIQHLDGGEPPSCPDCWWVVRQPYTPVHAFTQAVHDPARPWRPSLPAGCRRPIAWDSPSGLVLWQIQCPK